jgi:tRNA nucleotidyltransferase (CCA-adding enzyme)
MKNTSFSVSEAQAAFPQDDDFEQWINWASTAKNPSRLLTHLKETQRLSNYPELAALDGVPQEPQYHPEGDALTHTGLVMDAAAEIAIRERLDMQQRALLVLAALTHDFGKATMTRTITKNEKPYISSAGHERASGPLAKVFLRRIGADEATIALIVALVENHMAHVDYLHGAGEEEVGALAQLIVPADLQMLAYLIEADTSGRPPLPKGLPLGGVKMVEAAQSAGVLDGIEIKSRE